MQYLQQKKNFLFALILQPKKFEHLNLGSWGKKTFKWSEQMKKKIRKKKSLWSGDFTPFMSKSFQM